MSAAITAAQLLAGKTCNGRTAATAHCRQLANTSRSDAKFSNLFAKTSAHIVCTSARLQRQPALVSINLLNGREETKSVLGSFLYIFTKCAKDSSNLLDSDILFFISFIFVFLFLVEKLMYIKIFGPSGFVESLKLSWRNIKS